MKKYLDFIKSLSKTAIICMGICALTQLATYYIPMIFGRDTVRTLTSALDERIPFIPGFVFIYVAAFVFWVVCFLRVFSQNLYIAKRLVLADSLAKLVCVLCFCLFPCTLKQPAAEEMRGFGAWALKIVYFFDKPTNLLPSMHCHASWLCLRSYLSRHNDGFSRGSKVFVVIFAVLICAATLFTKQHVVIDVVTGIAVADVMWIVAGGLLGKKYPVKE